ncbi:MAG: flavin reductase family protein [Candidatus Helarchaeota archaeon]|nr:flavin reductase family protein [Candidatus Helarchaeota archaeon]
MSKVEIGPYQLAEITLSKDTLLVSKNKDKVNVMALAWKSIGELWGYPICTVAVAPSRYTFSLLNDLQEFTLNVPSPKIESAVNIAGSYSGRDTDKIAQASLTLTPSRFISVPMIQEAMINYECKIIHTAESGSICSHRLFFGEILAAYAENSLLTKK